MEQASVWRWSPVAQDPIVVWICFITSTNNIINNNNNINNSFWRK